MHNKKPSKSGTSARSAGKKNAPAPASVPVPVRATRHRPAREKSPVAPASGLPAALVEPVVDRGIRTSISLYGSDLDCLEPLRSFLRVQTGVRNVADSALVQVLCRCAKPAPEHVPAFFAVQAATGRKYRR